MSEPRSITVTVLPVPHRPEYWLFECVGYPRGGPSKIPFLDAARALLRDGWKPDTIIEMVHASRPEVVALLATIGTAAGLTVVETPSGPRFRPWRPDQRFVRDENLTKPEIEYPL